MSQILNHEKAKDKKKSFVERLVQFASHTMRRNRKSDSKSKVKKPLNKDNRCGDNNISLKLLQMEIQTCTFCDYCDKEIVAQFTGQNIIYHEACKKNHHEDFPVEPNLDLEIPDLLSSIKSDNLRLSGEHMVESKAYLNSRLSTSLNDLSLHGTSVSPDLTLVSRVDRDTSLDMVGSNSFLLDNETGTYTFSTADLCTIKQFGISIKNVTLVGEVAPLQNKITNHATIVPADDLSQRQSIGSINYSVLPEDELMLMMEIFNNNDQGLFIERNGAQINGKIRVFINLLRPIKMLLTARPPSMFDALPDNVVPNQSTIDRAYYHKEVIFRLPRGTTKLLYIDINCPTTDVISLLLSKFSIRNNPKKFSLYQHSIKSPKEVEVCKLRSSQFPLKVMLDWCSKGSEHYQHCLDTRKFVLQENDPGSIEWDEFSIPELRSFLTILGQEEDEKRKQISCKYDILKSDIRRRLTLFGRSR